MHLEISLREGYSNATILRDGVLDRSRAKMQDWINEGSRNTNEFLQAKAEAGR